MAEVRGSQVALLAEIQGQHIQASQVALLAEIGFASEVEDDGTHVRASQVALLAEIDLIQVRASQVLILIEVAPPASPWPGQGQAAATLSQAAHRAPTVSRAAAQAGGALFAALAASRARVAPTTSLAALAPQSSPTGAGMSATRTLTPQILIYWDGVTPTDETDYLISARAQENLTAPEQMLTAGRGAVTACTLTLSNHHARYSPANPTSPLHPHIAGGGAYLAPVHINLTIDGATQRLFTGLVRELSENAPTAKSAPTITLDCRSRDERLLQDKRSTPLAAYLAGGAHAQHEAHHIAGLLASAGLVDGIDYISHTYAAAHPPARPTIDAGLFSLAAVWLDDESVLTELWSLAAACCGWFYCDRSGIFHYHNLTAVLPASLTAHYGPVTTLELDQTQIAGLQLRRPTNELYSEITVETAPLTLGPVGELWNPGAVVIVQPGATKTIWARLSAPLAAAPTLTWAAYTANGAPLASGVTVVATPYAQRVQLDITNTTTRTAYLNTLTLTGPTLIADAKRDAIRTSTHPFWTNRPPRARTIRSNPYIQTETQAATIAAYALQRQHLPLLTATVPNVDRHDLRLGWPVRLTYTDAAAATLPVAAPLEGIVTALDWTLDRTGYRQTITVMETASLFAGFAPLFVLGQHRIGATGAAGEAHLFY